MERIRNVNVGVLGHVDAGKTALCKALSSIASTAAFDKDPMSKERGITLDLGFSAMTLDDKLQFTFVDCPGHASLIRTVIGGAQIINFMLLVIDVTKGIQLQTMECIVIAQITCPRMIIVLNKVDKLPIDRKDIIIQKMSEKFRKAFQEKGISISDIVPVSATENENLPALQTAMVQAVAPAEKDDPKTPFIFSIDHCFTIRGKGTICTGTVLQGGLKIGDSVEVPQLSCQRVVKSIEMFRKPLEKATKGDRLGVCITQFDSKQVERGLLCTPGSVPFCHCAVIKFHSVELFKGHIRSKSKFHVSVGHATVLGSITLLKANENEDSFQMNDVHEYAEEVEEGGRYFVILEFEKPILWTPECLLICSKLDLEPNVQSSNQSSCRLAFYGRVLAGSSSVNYKEDFLSNIKLYRQKEKVGSIQRVVNDSEIIVEDFFRKTSNRDIFIGLNVSLSSGQMGRIEGTFGMSSKVKILLRDPLTPDDVQNVKGIQVKLQFKKLLFTSNKRIFQ